MHRIKSGSIKSADKSRTHEEQKNGVRHNGPIDLPSHKSLGEGGWRRRDTRHLQNHSPRSVRQVFRNALPLDPCTRKSTLRFRNRDGGWKLSGKEER